MHTFLYTFYCFLISEAPNELNSKGNVLVSMQIIQVILYKGVEVAEIAKSMAFMYI